MNQDKKIAALTVIISLNFLIVGFLGGSFYQSKKNEDEVERLKYYIENILPRDLPPGKEPWGDLKEKYGIEKLLNATVISGTVVRKNDLGVVLKTRLALVGVDTTNLRKSENIEIGDEIIFTGKFNKSSRIPFFEAEDFKKD